MKNILIGLLIASVAGGFALAETVYVTARPPSCTVVADCPGPNMDGTYSEQWPGLGDYGWEGTATGRPPTKAARTYIGSTAVTDPNYGVTLTPTLGVPGGVYRIDYNFNSLPANTSTNVVMSATCVLGGTLSFETTDKFQRAYGNPADRWHTMGYLTNSPGSTTPIIEFRYLSGEVSGATQNRMIFDCWAFILLEPCLAVPPVPVHGPLGVDSTEVVVAEVDGNATEVTVYQDSGVGMVVIGSKTADITPGINRVPVSGLVKNAQVAATQTIDAQEGCVPAQGTLVGGGANPSIRVALTIRETAATEATVGSAGSTASANLHFLGASEVSAGAPVDAQVIQPAVGWQTVTFSRGNEFVDNVPNATGNVRPPQGPNPYSASEIVQIQVYAFRTIQPENVTVYSRVPAESAELTSDNAFGVDWSWDPVPEADGYRLLRTITDPWGSFWDGTDVTGTSFADDDWTIWSPDNLDVTPTSVQRGASVQWNPTVGNVGNLPGTWGTLESINFVIDDPTDTGPYDIYIDNLQNGDIVFQTFEEAPAGTTGYAFRPPSFSGTTSGNLLSAPNVGQVSNAAADTGTKSFRVRWQWTTPSPTRWLRLTTFQAVPVSNPYVNLDEPISFRMLLQPVGTTPEPPPPPALSIGVMDGQQVLAWEGAHRLQTAEQVDGPYVNVPQTLNPNTYIGPWTNTFTEPTRFFRLLD